MRLPAEVVAELRERTHGVVTPAMSRLDTETAEVIERLRAENAAWSISAAGAYGSGLEQLNRILVGLVRQYGRDGRLTLTRDTAHGVPLGAQVRWGCLGEEQDYIVIGEAAEAAGETDENAE